MGAATNSDAELTRLLLLSRAGHLRCFSDQPIAEIVHCGEPLFLQKSISRPREIRFCDMDSDTSGGAGVGVASVGDCGLGLVGFDGLSAAAP